jgi:hypothetical protein
LTATRSAHRISSYEQHYAAVAIFENRSRGAEIPISQRDEIERAIVEIIAGERPRMAYLVPT